MDAFAQATGGRGSRRWAFGLAALALACGGAALAQVVAVPAAHLHHAEGTVAHAPQGDSEWQDVQPRRLLKRGDRLWTDGGSRAELQTGGHALRMNGQTQVVLENVGETATQLSLTQGSIAATVTRMQPGDSFEIGTPNLAFRARQVGDYRIDVDTKQGVTRVAVLSGAGVVYGEKGEAMEIRTGQRITFRERALVRVQQGAFAATDDFDRWAGARRRGEPTVSMPNLAQAAPVKTPLPATGMVHRGPDLVISGPATSLPGSKLAQTVTSPQVAAAAPQAAPAAKPAAVTPAAAPLVHAPQQPVARAQAIPNVQVTPAVPAAAPMRVNTQAAAAQAQVQQAQAQAQAQQAQDQAQAQAEAQARAKSQAEAQARQRAEQDRRAAVAQEARRAEERRRAVAARRAEEEKRALLAKREQEHKRLAAARRAEDERRIASARRAAEEKRLAAARRVEAERLADARQRQLARLQEQAAREEQSVQARREQAARKLEEEREQARREDFAKREEQVRREEQARREDVLRQRALAEQVRRDQERRDQEVWLRQQQQQQHYVPVRPVPMGVPLGVPARRVS